MRKINNILAIIALAVMVLSFPLYASASSGTGTVQVPKNCIMKSVGKITRTTKYGYVNVKANSVYPTGTYKKDNFTKCTTRLYHATSTGTAISDKYTLTEGGGYKKVYVYQGYLDQTTVNLCFGGNNPDYAAYVNYTYDGK